MVLFKDYLDKIKRDASSNLIAWKDEPIGHG